MAEIENLTLNVDTTGINDYLYLLWFRCNADFGPAHGDVISFLNEQYEKETGNKVPDGCGEEE